MVVVEENYVENPNFPYCTNTFLCTVKLGKNITFAQSLWRKESENVINRQFVHFPQVLWKNQRRELMFAVMSLM